MANVGPILNTDKHYAYCDPCRWESRAMDSYGEAQGLADLHDRQHGVTVTISARFPDECYADVFRAAFNTWFADCEWSGISNVTCGK